MPDKYPLSRRAVLQRLSRSLARKNQLLRGSRGRFADGTYCIVSRQGVVARDVDILGLAETLGVIHPWEELRP
jgi:hypothetical protein